MGMIHPARDPRIPVSGRGMATVFLLEAFPQAGGRSTGTCKNRTARPGEPLCRVHSLMLSGTALE